MLIQTPDKLLPYVVYDKDKTLIHTKGMPEDLMPLFLEFLDAVKELDEQGRKWPNT